MLSPSSMIMQVGSLEMGERYLFSILDRFLVITGLKIISFFQISNSDLKIKDLLNANKSQNLSLISNIFNNTKDVEVIIRIYMQSSILIDKRVWPFTKN